MRKSSKWGKGCNISAILPQSWNQHLPVWEIDRWIQTKEKNSSALFDMNIVYKCPRVYIISPWN